MGEQKKRGGARKGAGRPKGPPKVALSDQGHAARVLDRIGELNLTWKDSKGREIQIKNAEDYSLWLLSSPIHGAAEFTRLREKRDGKAVQTVNHLHDKPIEMNLSVSLSEAISKARKRVTSQ
jgi:hypothetical protein